jgi:dephospho-CoA kinase
MMATIAYTEVLETTRCWCGISLAVPSNLLRNAYDHGTQIYCPIGHKFGWKETEADRQRKRAEQAEARAKRAEERRQAERDLREHTERQLSAQRGATTRAKKRSAAGVCPCCNRSFKQIRHHMASQHPDYKPEERS